MLNQNNQYVQFGDSKSIDNTGRARVSSPHTIFESQFEYWDYSPLWHSVVTSGGTITHNPQTSSMKMDVTGTAGATSIRQSKEYFRYVPGHSYQAMASFSFGSTPTGIAKRVGYFDINNGLFLEYYNNILYIVLRSDITGSVVDTKIPQSSWNLDRLDDSTDGEGQNITLDPTKVQTLVGDFSYGGSGRIRIGFYVEGEIVYVHEIISNNEFDMPAASTANLPIRYEIENISSITTSTMYQHACAVISENGNTDESGCFRSASRELNLLTVKATPLPVISIRPKLTVGTKTNRGVIKPQAFKVLNTSNYEVYVKLILNGTLTGASWTDLDAYCIAQKDTSATAITGGVVLFDDFVPAGGAVAKSAVSSKESKTKKSLVVNYDGTDADVLTVVCQSIDASSGSDVSASIEIISLF